MTKHEKKFELIEQRSVLLKKARESADDTEAFKGLMAEADTLEQRINNLSRLEDAERSELGTPLNGSDRKLTDELRTFSVRKVMAHALGLGGVDAGREIELQSEMAKRAGRKADGFFIPAEAFEQRTITGSSGAALIGTDHRSDLTINMLQAQSVISQLGATTLTGLRPDLSIPRISGGPVSGWVSDDSVIPTGDATFDNVTLTPKTVGVIVPVSRKMLLQSDPSVEQLVANLMAQNIAQTVDQAIIAGTGGAMPTGILSQSGIQTITSPDSIFDAVADAEGLADISNVNAKRGILAHMGIKKIARKALDGQGRPLGVSTVFGDVPTVFSNLVPKAGAASPPTDLPLLYGAWDELIVAWWAQLEILYNPYESTQYSKAGLSIRATASVDCALKHPASFVWVQNIATNTTAMPASS